MNYPLFEEYIKHTSSLDTEAINFKIWKSINEERTPERTSGGTKGSDPVRNKVIAMSNEEVLAKAEKVMQLANLKIVNNYEWFKPYLTIMPPIAQFGAGSVQADGVGTMSTNGAEIHYDPRFVLISYEQAKIDFASKLNKEKNPGAISANINGSIWYSDYACFVIIHEIMHNSLKHFLRHRSEVQSEWISPMEVFRLWNIAQDYEINRILKYEVKGNLEIFPGCVDLEEGPFKVDDKDKEWFQKSTSDKIFWRLFKELEEENKAKGAENPPPPPPPGPPEPETPPEVGDIIWDSEKGEYGRVTKIDGDDVEWDEMTEEEVTEELYGKGPLPDPHGGSSSAPMGTGDENGLDDEEEDFDFGDLPDWAK